MFAVDHLNKNFIINFVNFIITLTALVSTFLHVHPFGATIDYIWSYLNRLDVKIRSSELEELIERFPRVFAEETSTVGTLEKKWKFIGFDPERKIL